jgi:hypothetical protein
MFPERSLNVPQMFPKTQQAASAEELAKISEQDFIIGPMLRQRSIEVNVALNVPYMFPESSLNVPSVFPQCSLSVPSMFRECGKLLMAYALLH